MKGGHMKRKAENKTESELVSFDALDWLMSVNYASKSQEEIAILIKAAMIAYPIKVDLGKDK